jgi:hypothetical protein
MLERAAGAMPIDEGGGAASGLEGSGARDDELCGIIGDDGMEGRDPGNPGGPFDTDGLLRSFDGSGGGGGGGGFLPAPARRAASAPGPGGGGGGAAWGVGGGGRSAKLVMSTDGIGSRIAALRLSSLSAPCCAT